MRGVLGIILIGGGLTVAYFVLSGKFPPSATTSTSSSTTNEGGGGKSLQSSMTQLGYALAVHPRDMVASRGFK